MKRPPIPRPIRLLAICLAAGAIFSQQLPAQDSGATLNPVAPAANPVLAATANPAQSAGASVAPAPALANLPSASGAYVLRPGDIVSILVFREPDLAVTARISEAGEITYPFLGQVKVAGLSAYGAQELIRRKLDADYLVNPQVALSVMEQAKEYFTVMGEVTRPGIYELPAEGGLNLLQSIGMAGGFTHTAKYTAVQIMRSEEGRNVTFTVDARDIARSKTKDPCVIHAGDVITVPQSWF